MQAKDDASLADELEIAFERWRSGSAVGKEHFACLAHDNLSAILSALRRSDSDTELLREAREDTHLIAMLDPSRFADDRLTGERIREAGDRLTRIDARLNGDQP